ncbi:hypothetical protein BH20GEM2_BH20GEM2_15940 [soil metagenome]
MLLGLAIMLILMGGVTVFVTIKFLLQGQAPFIASETTYGKTVFTYALGGVVGGVAGGLALPLTRWRWGSALAGGLAFISVYGSVVFVQEGPPWTWDAWDMAFVLLTGLFVGGVLGYYFDRKLTTPYDQ